MKKQLNILVTGATGAVGPVVVEELLRSGHNVRTLSLDSAPDNLWPKSVEQLVGDITNPSEVMAAMKDIDAVVHLASLLHIVNPPLSLQSKYERVNVDGTDNVVKAAIANELKQVILFSTIAVYGSSNRNLWNEQSPVNPDTFYAKTKLVAERIVLEAKSKEGGHIGTVLRLGAVYGPGIKGNYHRLVMALAKNRFLPIGKGDNRRTLVYDKDVARAVLAVLENNQSKGKLYNVTDGTPHSMDEIISAICIALNKRKPCLTLPLKPIRVAASLIEDIAGKLGIYSPVTRAAIDKYVEDIAVESSLMQSELNFIPKFRLLDGWKETIELMRKNGDL